MRPWTFCAVLVGFCEMVDGRLMPYVPDLPHRLTASTLSVYVNKTFGPYQRCLKVVADDSAEAEMIVAMFNRHYWTQGPRRKRNGGCGGGGGCDSDENRDFTDVGSVMTTTRTIELDESGDGPAFCAAYVVVGRQLETIEHYLENFRSNAAERMLVIVVQNRKYIKPFIKYSPEYFNYKDIILINVYPQKETVYKMSIHYGKFVSIPKKNDQWLRHDLEGKHMVKNFHKTRIKLLTYNNSFFSSVVKDNATRKLSLSNGIECIIFKEIASRLNVTWDVYTSNDVDKWGTISPNNSISGGALKWLYEKRADVSFCSLWIEDIRIKYSDMSRYWGLMCLKFLVPEPQLLRDKWDLLFKPFSLYVWVLVFLSATLTTIAMWMLANVQKKIGYAKTNAFTSLSTTIFWIIGMMLLTSYPRTLQMGPIRHLISWWFMFVFIMSTLFSSILYSYTTSSEYTNIVLEVEDMVKANYHWGLTYPPPFKSILNMQNPVHQAFSKKFVPEHTTKDRVRRLRRGKYAMLAKCMYEKHFMESDGVPAAVLNTMRTTRTCMNQFYVGFGFVKRSPYVKSANLVIQRIVESGLVDYWLSRVTEVRISPATFEQVYDSKPQRSGEPSPLSYRQFKVVMVVWTVGCALSTVVFLVECKYGGQNDDPWWLIDPVSGRYVNVGSLGKKLKIRRPVAGPDRETVKGTVTGPGII